MTSNMQFTYEVGHEILVADDVNTLLSKILIIYSKFADIDRGMISVSLKGRGGGVFTSSHGFSDEDRSAAAGDMDALCFPEITFIEGGVTRVRVPVVPDAACSSYFIFDLLSDNLSGREQLGLLISVTVIIGYALGLKVRSLVNDEPVEEGSGPDNISLVDHINSIQKDLIIKYLKRHKGNITRAAVNLGTTKRVLNYKIKALRIDFKQFKK